MEQCKTCETPVELDIKVRTYWRAKLITPIDVTYTFCSKDCFDLFTYQRYVIEEFGSNYDDFEDDEDYLSDNE